MWGDMNRAWELRKNELLLGILMAKGTNDFPWFDCVFEPTREFSPYWQLFAEEARLLLEGADTDRQQQLKLYQDEIKELGLYLIQFGKPKAVQDFLLHIEGEKARLRLGHTNLLSKDKNIHE